MAQDNTIEQDGIATDAGAGTKSEQRLARRNYLIFVIQGIMANASKRIGSAKLLLPYLYVATGAPVFLAGMLMPLVSASRLIGQFLSAPVINAAQSRKWFLFWGWMATAAGLGAAGLSAHLSVHWLVMAIFVLAALAMGFAKGMNALAFNDLISFNIGKSRRNAGVFLMSAAAGVVTISVTWATHHFSSKADKLDHYVNLAFSAAAVTALAACIILLFKENPAPQHKTALAQASESRRARFVAGYAKLIDVLRFRWFRQYLVMRCLTTTVILAMPFYAVHGATHHAHKSSGALSAFVIATSIAVIVCGPLWKWMGQKSQRYTMAVGAATVGLAGIWTIVIDQTPALQTVLAHSAVFAMAAAGIQAVNGSRMLFLIEAAPKSELTYFVTASNTVSAVFALILASGFGYIAQIQGVLWPVILVSGLNFVAAFHSLVLTNPKKAEDGNE
ncbi:MAG: MFS transporter [Pseudomonadota bacterium]